MASVAVTRRLAGRAARTATRHGARGFYYCAINSAAHNFTMPAMSPTMTEGNIASWKVKEGDSFSAGDVLLEIETDKAQMDVEAQDDGILAKITQGDGSKSVKVGTRIAVTADAGDDVASLTIPPEDNAAPATNSASSSQESPPQSEASGVDRSESSKSADESSPPSKGGKATSASKSEAGSQEAAGSRKQKYPLYPSVQHLLHENGLSAAEADKIPATGPNGRLLKGDVLAHLGRIDQSYTAEQSHRLRTLSHLDLSNIKKAAPKKVVEEDLKKTGAPEPGQRISEPSVDVALPISMDAVISCQGKFQHALGVWLPLAGFVARAAQRANKDLPRSRTAKPTTNELFDAVLGLDNAAKGASTRGHFRPQLTGFSPLPSSQAKVNRVPKELDIFDLLTGRPSVPRKEGTAAADATAPKVGTMMLRLNTSKAEEHRARMFLGRVKTMLESEPGRLLL